MAILEKLKSFGGGLLGFAMFIGFFLLFAILWAGVAAVSAFLYPIFSILAGLAITIFVGLVLPLSLVHRLRPFLCQTTIVLSWVCGATIWMYSFLVIVGYLGWWAILLLFMFQVVAPIAVIGLFIKQQWYGGLSILVGLVVTFGMRFYAIWLAQKYESREALSQRNQIIEVEATPTD